MSQLKAASIISHLESIGDKERAKQSIRYFRCGPGEYGEGDLFLGIRVPELRKLVRGLHTLELPECIKLLKSKWHEARLLALLVMVAKYKKGDANAELEIYQAYVDHMRFVNNWDLVDSSAPGIVGAALFQASRKPLYRWVKSDSLWNRRIAVLATAYFIKQGEFEDTLGICKLLLGDSEDLIHKATGGMLREVGLRNHEPLIDFLEQHVNQMPRTMLRYALERLPPKVRADFMAR